MYDFRYAGVTTASPRNSTWFTRPFLLVRGWGLGTRLAVSMDNWGERSEPHTCGENGKLSIYLFIYIYIYRGRAVETADQKEHRLSKPRKKEKAWRAARAAAEVVL